ncbi:hypothetical protein AAF712_005392 [Marasmius tenuissimus]|uniref:N-acetyltransferase domain-containing protein n=1 Tax=Marasmius tenuissimus TaxID=585030 RepID=A0ABR3A570_9AGAR
MSQSNVNQRSPAPAHEVVIATTEEEIQQCLQVRIDVFHHEQGFPLDTEIDQYDSDPTVKHFLLRLTPSLVPIGVIRGTKTLKDGHSLHTYKLSRLAILKPYRQYKLGRKLVEALHDWIRFDAKAFHQTLIDQGTYGGPPPPHFVKVIAHSQIPAKGFYEKFGYMPEVSKARDSALSQTPTGNLAQNLH